MDKLSDSDAKRLQDATLNTANDLKTVMTNLSEEQLSEISLPELDEAVSIIARMVPAGNVPGLIASGLARLRGKSPSHKHVRRDLNMLMHGVHQMMDKAKYELVFHTPARILHGYQMLRKITGSSLEDAFPEGTWQFYAEYALREDSARHANETHGFATALREDNIALRDADRASAWVMAAINTLHWYPALLENEWRERVYIRELQATHDRYSDLWGRWLAVLPYRLGKDALPDETYPQYRRRKFETWLFAIADGLRRRDRQAWHKRFKAEEKLRSAAYVAQMTIHSSLEPQQYSELQHDKPLNNLYVGLVHDKHYYMLPICQANSTNPVSLNFVRQSLAIIYDNPTKTAPVSLTSLARLRRQEWEGLKRDLPVAVTDELKLLDLCPIIINLNPHERRLPLAQIRQSERGIGNHAMTLFDAGDTMIFDQSHIYFDGAWGVALAEIMTNIATDWGRKIAATPFSPDKTVKRPYALQLKFTKALQKQIAALPTATDEVTAESNNVDVPRMNQLRKLFQQRNDSLRLTVNDLLLLYRAIHAITYRVPTLLVEDLQDLAKKKKTRDAAELAFNASQARQTPPDVLIPVDASRREPYERVHPMSFSVPLDRLQLREKHRNVMQALRAYTQGQADGSEFDKLQRDYLASLAGFGMVMAHAKEIANRGESESVGSIKLLAHLPQNLQHFLYQIPGRFDFLNDLMRGREVFSNVGQVAKSSTLTRFVTAKDDNEQKSLAWGVLTDAEDTMVITLRDFRPHVAALSQIGRRDIAERIAQHYLTSYVDGFNTYINDLFFITKASPETSLKGPQ